MSIATLPEPNTVATIVVANGDDLYEIVNGERVEMPSMSAYSSWLASRLHAKMSQSIEKSNSGTVICETLFILDPVKDLRRRPDVAFVSKERWPLDKPIPETGDWLVVPDLAVEVISPNDAVEEYLEKLKGYFKYGVRQVWVVVPRSREVLVYASPSQHQSLSSEDELDGGAIVPGFRMKLADLFKQPVETA